MMFDTDTLQDLQKCSMNFDGFCRLKNGGYVVDTHIQKIADFGSHLSGQEGSATCGTQTH